MDPALGFAVSVWIDDFMSEFFVTLRRFRLDGYDPSINLIRIYLLTFTPSERTELLLCASSRHLSTSLPRNANGFPQAAAIGVPAEITASSILITYWDTNVSYGRVAPREQQLIVAISGNTYPSTSWL